MLSRKRSLWCNHLRLRFFERSPNLAERSKRDTAKGLKYMAQQTDNGSFRAGSLGAEVRQHLNELQDNVADFLDESRENRLDTAESLRQDAAQARRERLQGLADLRANVSEFLLRDVGGLIKKISDERSENRAQLMADMSDWIATFRAETSDLINTIQANHADMSDALRQDLAAWRAGLDAEVTALMDSYFDARMLRNNELTESLGAFCRDLQAYVDDTLTRFEQERLDTAEADHQARRSALDALSNEVNDLLTSVVPGWTGLTVREASGITPTTKPAAPAPVRPRKERKPRRSEATTQDSQPPAAEEPAPAAADITPQPTQQPAPQPAPEPIEEQPVQQEPAQAQPEPVSQESTEAPVDAPLDAEPESTETEEPSASPKGMATEPETLTAAQVLAQARARAQAARKQAEDEYRAA